MFNDIVLSLFDGFRITNPLVICLGGVTNSPGQTDQRLANNVMKDIGHNNSENSTWLNLFICGQFDTLISSHTHIFHQISKVVWIHKLHQSINP